jgi:hypothetical protein
VNTIYVLVNKSCCLIILNDPLILWHELKNALTGVEVSADKVFNYASLGVVVLNFVEWLELLPTLEQKGCKKLSITMIQPKEINYFGSVNREKFK